MGESNLMHVHSNCLICMHFIWINPVISTLDPSTTECTTHYHYLPIPVFFANIVQTCIKAVRVQRYLYIYTRCTYLQCMPRAHLHDLWTSTFGLVGVATCSWSVMHVQRTKCKKCEKEGKAYALRWKSSRMWAHFQTAQNAKIWSFIKTTMCFICFARRCCSLSYSLFSTQTSQRWVCIYALSSPFSHQAPNFFFSLPS